MKSPQERHDGASGSGVAPGLLSKRRNPEKEDNNADVDVECCSPQSTRAHVCFSKSGHNGRKGHRHCCSARGHRKCRVYSGWTWTRNPYGTNWVSRPKLAFDIEGILAAKLRLGTMMKFYPMIAALKKDLQVTRDNIDETPRGDDWAHVAYFSANSCQELLPFW